MRRIAVCNKTLRGIPRHLRALERWAAGFKDLYFLPSKNPGREVHWKIPVHAALVEGPKARIEDQAFCIQQLLEAAAHLSEAADRSEGYYRVACVLTWPWLHGSQVAVFYDRDYYLRFLGTANSLTPDRLSQKLALHVPEHFIEHGHDITDPDGEVMYQRWCIGERPD